MTDYSKLPIGEVDVVAKLDRIVKEFSNGYAFGRYLTWDKEVLEYVGAKEERIFFMVKGNSLPRVKKVCYKLHGRWSVDDKGKLWFNVSYSEMLETKSKKSAEEMLISESFPSVTRKMAKALIDYFGENIWTVIGGDSWQTLTAVEGITEENAKQIHLSYIRVRSVTMLTSYLGKFGVSAHTIEKINDVYHENAIDYINEDPYRMIKEVRGVGFETCDRIAKELFRQGKRPDVLKSPARVDAGILTSLRQECATTGGMYVEAYRLFNISMERLNNGLPTNEQQINTKLWRQRYDSLIADGSIVERRFKMKDGSIVRYVFPAEFDRAERMTAFQILNRRKKPTGISEADAVAEVAEYSSNLKFPLSKNQQAACVKSLLNRISIITGGPGTGKTTILKCLISSYKKLLGNNVTCIAPTGKAARRMSESTGLPATTIHSRLNLVTIDGVDLETNKIEDGLVVVDEVSMVDTVLMSKLLENLGPDCQLVLVGDVDQLPSVGEGAVLFELIRSQCVPTSRLTETFRQGNGSVIITNAAKVNAGRYDLEYTDDFRYVEANGEKDAVEKISKIYKESVEKYGIDNVALLSPLRANREGAHPCSSDGINPVLQDIFNPHDDEKPCLSIGETEYRLNDRVMKWSNGEKSSNGDIGVITDFLVDNGVPALEVQWDNGNTEVIRKQDLDSLTLAYSMSVHKSQGSEYACVIIPVLSDQICPLSHKRLLYTAITRGKTEIILLGDKKCIKYMCTHNDGSKRNTLLATRLVYNNAQNAQKKLKKFYKK